MKIIIAKYGALNVKPLVYQSHQRLLFFNLFLEGKVLTLPHAVAPFCNTPCDDTNRVYF